MILIFYKITIIKDFNLLFLGIRYGETKILELNKGFPGT